MDLNRLTVKDLKAELLSRNLDTNGLKAVLVGRLAKSIEEENAGAGSTAVSGNAPRSMSEDEEVNRLRAKLAKSEATVLKLNKSLIKAIEGELSLREKLEFSLTEQVALYERLILAKTLLRQNQLKTLTIKQEPTDGVKRELNKSNTSQQQEQLIHHDCAKIERDYSMLRQGIDQVINFIGEKVQKSSHSAPRTR